MTLNSAATLLNAVLMPKIRQHSFPAPVKLPNGTLPAAWVSVSILKFIPDTAFRRFMTA